MTSPAHNGILAENYTIRYASGVRRQPLEDGAVRQARRLTRPVETTDMTLLLGETAARDAFAAWADNQSHDWFALTLLHRDGDVRVVGGAVGIVYRQRNAGPGWPAWECTLSVESRPLALDAADTVSEVWPAYARVLGSGEMGVEGIVRRTGVAQGPPVRQGDPTGPAGLRSHRLRALLTADRLLPFLQFCYHAERRGFWFPINGPAGTQQRRRLVDGLGSLAVRQGARVAGNPYWLAELLTEGYEWDTRIMEAGDG